MFKIGCQFDIFKERLYRSAYEYKYTYEKERKTGETRSRQLAESYAKAKTKKIIVNQKTNPLKYYCPNIPGEKIINTFANCTKNSNLPVILFSCGNGIGKTESALQIVSNLVLGPKNGWFDQGVFKKWDYPKLIWYITTGTCAKNNVAPFFRDNFKNIEQYRYNKSTGLPEKIDVKLSKDGASYDKVFRFSNGWTLEIKTFDQDIQQFESATVGLIIIDEPCPENIFRASLSRRRKGCITFLPMTPLDVEPYVKESIIDKAEENKPGYFFVTGDLLDCSKAKSERGHLDDDVITGMIESYSEDELDARVHGNFTYFSTRIYDTFDKNVNVVNRDDFPIHDAKYIVQAVDPHEGRPCACVYIAFMENGRKILFAETPYRDEKDTPYWKLKPKTQVPKDNIIMWSRLEHNYNLENKQVVRVMDRHFGSQTRGGTTLIILYLKESRELGLNFLFKESYKSGSELSEIDYGHSIVKAMFKNTLDDGHPELVIWDTCFHSINGVYKYIRKPPHTKEEFNKALGSTKIVEKFKDFPDAIRYALCTPIGATVKKKRDYSFLNKYHKNKKRGRRGY